MKRWIHALLGGTVICLILSLCGFEGACDGVRQDVVRLHILANSDTAEDQALKLKVRDAITEKTSGWLDGIDARQEAVATVEKCLPQLQQIAEQTIRESGYAYPVSVSLSDMYFTTRVYGEVTMPAGVYKAVRIEIGEGAGKNWWCVIYPPMCIQSAVKEETLSDVLSNRELTAIHGGEFAVRFKLVEIVQWILYRL